MIISLQINCMLILWKLHFFLLQGSPKQFNILLWIGTKQAHTFLCKRRKGGNGHNIPRTHLWMNILQTHQQFHVFNDHCLEYFLLRSNFLWKWGASFFPLLFTQNFRSRIKIQLGYALIRIVRFLNLQLILCLPDPRLFGVRWNTGSSECRRRSGCELYAHWSVHTVHTVHRIRPCCLRNGEEGRFHLKWWVFDWHDYVIIIIINPVCNGCQFKTLKV